MAAYYNEFDPYAAQWLRNLIAAGHIAPGDVDERSIEDVRPTDLSGYRQCHFFAGVGVWSYALRLAGIHDDYPVWTGSCPCQPFSAAGKGDGFADERHLWPAFFHLIAQCRPPAVLGEQVAGPDADPWIDLVCADLDGLGYATGATPFPSAGIGAPHVRDRLYWVALDGAMVDTIGAGLEGQRRHGDLGHQPGRLGAHAAGPTAAAGATGGLADDDAHGRSGQQAPRLHERRDGARCDEPAQGSADGARGHDADGRGDAGGLADTASGNASTERLQRSGQHGQRAQDGGVVRVAGRLPAGERWVIDADTRAGPVNGFWRAADWLFCRDGRWRPVMPGSFPLVDGTAARMGRGRTDWQTPAGPQGFGHRIGRLRGYGNAINAQAAATFIECLGLGSRLKE